MWRSDHLTALRHSICGERYSPVCLRTLEDGDSVVVKIDYDDREHRMKTDPKTFFITDHYRNYPMMIARLSAIDAEVLRELPDAARQHAGG